MSRAHTYRKKPVYVQAMQWTGDNYDEISRFVDGTTAMGEGGFSDRLLKGTDHENFLYIMTLEGLMEAKPGDYIIQGIKGEYYPCKPDIFNLTYEQV